MEPNPIMTVHGCDFDSIRHWRGSQDQAFEELCYQLRDPTPEGAELVKTGSPDGGLEWYVTLPDGEQWGWQVKYSKNIDSLLGNMKRSLETVVSKRPKCRKLTFCIPFDLPDGSAPDERKSARQKFDDRKKSWLKGIPGADLVQVELWSEGDLVERLTAHPAGRGIEWFFWQKEVFSQEWFADRQKIAADFAGGRYAPELHVDLPVSFAMEGLALSDAYWRRFSSHRSAVVRAAGEIEVSRYTGIGVTQELQRLVQSLTDWQSEVPTRGVLPDRLNVDRLLTVTGACLDDGHAAWSGSQSASSLESVEKRLSERHRDLQYRLQVLLRALEQVQVFLRTDASAAASRGALILTGGAGQGKTHLLCDTVQRAVEAGDPAVVLFGARFSGHQLWSDIAHQLGLPSIGSETLIGAMRAAAEASNTPFLLLIDALNEASDPYLWQVELPALFAEVADKPWISVGVSVRSTYLDMVVPKNGLSDIPRVEYRGFDGRYLEATESFFEFYGLEQPGIPLLTPEFTNPLFLKLYCEGLSEAGPSAPSQGTSHVSQVFDWYITRKTGQIESTLRLDPKTEPVRSAIEAFSRALVKENRDSLPRPVGAKLIDAVAPALIQWPNTLFGQLLNGGVLTEDVAWNLSKKESEIIVRFTYQRFADYRVGVALLSRLNGDSLQLRNALSPGKPLRTRLLKAPAGWIEALAVQMPEQFGVELLDAATWRLDRRTRDRWERAFILSIASRNPSAVTDRSRELLNKVLKRSPDLNELGLETLLAVAPSPGHLLNADTLHRLLRELPMPERDARWSIATYFAFDHGGPLDRLIRWAARGPYPDYPESVVELAAIPVVWSFTSPNRRMRDYATKALVQLVSSRLSVLVKLIRRFDRVDDPYVIERLAVASHGAVLCGGQDTPSAAVSVANEIKRVALSEVQVPNVITRDAVRGVFEWCARRGLIDDETYQEVLPPYGAEPPTKSRSSVKLMRRYGRESVPGQTVSGPYTDILYSVLGALSDFGTYVIDSQLSNFSRTPLSSTKPEALCNDIYPVEEGRCWTFERVLSLGWTPKRFSVFDRYHVARRSGRTDHKAERFGKKYQWIALRELMARVSDNFHFVGSYSGQSMKYEGPWQFFGRDIDPTLPPPAQAPDLNGETRIRPTFETDSSTWWVPPGPSYRVDDPPEAGGWGVDCTDIPEFEPSIRCTDTSGRRWVALYARYNWDDPRQDHDGLQFQHFRYHWSFVFSWLVSAGELKTLVSFLGHRLPSGRWMPEGRIMPTLHF